MPKPFIQAQIIREINPYEIRNTSLSIIKNPFKGPHDGNLPYYYVRSSFLHVDLRVNDLALSEQVSSFCENTPAQLIRSNTSSRHHLLVSNKTIGFSISDLTLEFQSVVSIGRSGRLWAFIVLRYHVVNPAWWRVMINKPTKFTSIQFANIRVWA